MNQAEKTKRAKGSIIYLITFMIFVLGIGAVLSFKATDIAEKRTRVLSRNLITSSSAYQTPAEEDILHVLQHRITAQPFNMISLFIFGCAILHTFFTHRFREIAHHIEDRHKSKQMKPDKEDIRYDLEKDLEQDKSFLAEFFHFLGEVEVVFAIWLFPLILSITYFFDWHTAVKYIESRDYTEPLFVVVIMTLASTRPVVRFAEGFLSLIAQIGKGSPAAWWLTILTVGPVLGSLITEPAAMTLSAMLLSRQFYDLKPSPKLSYATLGLLFTNISVGGVLTHFAAPPVIMVSKAWGWDTPHMASNFGWKAVLGIAIANTLYYFYFRKELAGLRKRKQVEAENKKMGKSGRPVPLWITVIHLALLAWTVIQNHHPALFIGTFLFFIAFYQATAPHQSYLQLKSPILVGTFLAGLVLHGGLQGWWISAILTRVSETVLLNLSIVLTAFNDNAAITYLTTLIPNFSDTMKYAVVAGAVTGGGLTVIANAPNPAGQSLLNHYFEDGISPLWLFMGAATPTAIMALCFCFL